MIMMMFMRLLRMLLMLLSMLWMSMMSMIQLRRSLALMQNIAIAFRTGVLGSSVV